MNIDIKELKELLTLLNEDGVGGFMYVVFRGKNSASIREFGNIYPQNVQITKPLSDEEIMEIYNQEFGFKPID